MTRRETRWPLPSLAMASVVATVIVSQLGCFAPTMAEDPLPGPEQDGAVFAAPDSHARHMSASILLGVAPEEASGWITEEARLERWFAEDVTMGDVGSPFVVAWPSQEKSWSGSVLELDRVSGRLVAEVDSARDGSPIRITFSRQSEAGFERVGIEIGPFGTEMADEVVAGGFREGMTEALGILKRAVAGEPTQPSRVPVVERVFHPLETPREGLEAEKKMKQVPVAPTTEPPPAPPKDGG